MILRRSTTLRMAAIAALCAPAFAVQASASGINEYTLSDSQTSTTVTSYQNDYQVQTNQSRTAAPSAQQFGEIVYDTQPYMPDASAGDTGTYQMQPYTGDTTVQPYQPSTAQPIYMPSATN